MQQIFKTVVSKYNKNNAFRLYDFLQSDHLTELLKELEGKEVSIEIKDMTNSTEKEKLYAYYHKVLLPVAIEAFRDDGWTDINARSADSMLKDHLAVEVSYNPLTDEQHFYPKDKKSMSKKVLWQFIQDCIVFLEVEKGFIVPEAEQFKK